jgi:cell division transport system permease protein
MKWSVLKLALLFVLSLSQILLLTFFLSYKNLNLILGSWSESSNLSVYLKTDASDEDKIKISSFLKENQQIETAEIITRDQSAKEFQNSLGEYAAGLLSDDELLYLVPESIEIKPVKSLSLESKIDLFQNVSLALKNFSGVEEVVFGADWLNRFSKADHILKSLGLVCFLTLFISMSFLAALMVRVLIEDSKSEIEVYNLLGATRWSIYRIFLKDLYLTIFLSLVLTFSFLYLIFNFVKNIYLKKEMFSFLSEKLVFLSLKEVVVFSVVVFCFIFFSSMLSLSASLKKVNHLTYD